MSRIYMSSGYTDGYGGGRGDGGCGRLETSFGFLIWQSIRVGFFFFLLTD